MCQAALCEIAGDPGVVLRYYSRPTDRPNAPWEYQGAGCVAGDRVVRLGEVRQAIERIIEDRYRQIAQPPVTTAPPGAALVNLPVLAWTADLGPHTLTFEQPLPGSITLTPSYTWRWNTGQVATGAGRPYSNSVSPTAMPDYYVSTTFQSPGGGSAALTATWTGQVEVPGLEPVPIEPLVYTGTASFDVVEAQAVLVDPGR
jgi:hypothetical protein